MLLFIYFFNKWRYLLNQKISESFARDKDFSASLNYSFKLVLVLVIYSYVTNYPENCSLEQQTCMISTNISSVVWGVQILPQWTLTTSLHEVVNMKLLPRSFMWLLSGIISMLVVPRCHPSVLVWWASLKNNSQHSIWLHQGKKVRRNRESVWAKYKSQSFVFQF